ncbi:GAF domain-containing sensor histidine kinase [Pseudomonas typographi]|uniref:histidine kinase n=1 Tax=Pseudomonas typographi TaxID=2715964 RepID=A0ABR7Z0H6_9PSED|nr:GAF domain-containing sensor histidine kinase [Pseudomonas typographi]MBD1550692.1 GAF domain-containing sensor histidine kinase [Pseudomonas typographi]MBD1589301.1 GAF domain-containing sensor histidine kinase [Pseudomonas typographi]MBD1598978.1 GAF domain-containing sensor histidine kinase [Pseudomonas typographi]
MVHTLNSAAADIAMIGRIHAVPSILQVVAESSGLRFVTIARVTDQHWAACAVLDRLGFGLQVGGELPLPSTLCQEVLASLGTVVIDKASTDPVYRDHDAPRQYRFESYISVPIVLGEGSFFGTLCAFDPLPARLKGSSVQAMMEGFARLIAVQIDSEAQMLRTEAALRHERELAELREQFIAVLGHDLRNPLFAIEAGAQLLLRRRHDERNRAVLDHIVSCSRRASRLVEDVLDFARGKLGSGLSVHMQECPELAVTLRHVVDELQHIHPHRSLLLQLGELAGVHCDGERVGQLLSNLLSNAIVHGAADTPVTVRAGCEGGYFVLSVHNHGEPIETALLGKLFQPFSRLATEPTRSGLGLGLYIAQQIAQAHGATLDVSSSKALGTLFTFRLPLPSSDTSLALPAPK